MPHVDEGSDPPGEAKRLASGFRPARFAVRAVSICTFLASAVLTSAVLAGAVMAGPAFAQSMTQPVPLTPGSPTYYAPKPAKPERPVAAAAAPAAEGGETLRHLAANAHGFRLIGELDSSEWPVYLTDAQARGRLRFRIGYLTSISVMPEASTLTVFVNDVAVGRTELEAPNGVKTLTFDVRSDLVQPGFNAVRIVAEQRHRVDCSLDATYELWTQIDPSQTGFLLPSASAGITNPADFAALPLDPFGSLPIRAVIPGKTSLSNLGSILRAVELVTLSGRFEQPIVDFGPVGDGAFGVNLAVGVQSELAKLPGLEGLRAGAGPAVEIVPSAAGRRTTLAVTGATAGDVDVALTRLAAPAAPRGTEQGLRAYANALGFPVDGNQRVKLRDLGVTSVEFKGRLARLGFDVVMPADFYAADYGKVTLALDGAYASGLEAREAQVLIRVNGRDATSLPLLKTSGDAFRGNEVSWPLSLMRPGLNRIEIYARVPSATDTACDTLAAAGGRGRFLLLDSTELILPRIARVAQVPNLGLMTTGGFPFSAEGTRPRLFVPAPDRETMGAAATIAARVALASRRPLNFELALSPTEKPEGATLVVAPAKFLTPALMSAAGIEPERLLEAWQSRIDEAPHAPPEDANVRSLIGSRAYLQSTVPPACRVGRPGAPQQVSARDREQPLRTQTVAATSSIADAKDGTASGSLRGDWDESFSASPGWISTNAVVRALHRGAAWVGRGFESLWTGSRRGAAQPSPLSASASLVLSQGLNGETASDLLTLVTAPTARALSEAVPCLVDPGVWLRVRGQTASVDASDGSVIVAPAQERHFMFGEPFRLANLRLVAAGWLSQNPGAYVLLVLATAVLLGAMTASLLRHVGRKGGA